MVRLLVIVVVATLGVKLSPESVKFIEKSSDLYSSARAEGLGIIRNIIKTNKTDLSGIIQTFLRYNYNIKGTFSKDNLLDDYLDDRFDSFLRYLNT